MFVSCQYSQGDRRYERKSTLRWISCFHLRPSCRKGLEDNTYPAMDLPVHRESDGVIQ